MATTLRRRVSLATALLVGAGSLTAIAAPAQATPPQCTDGAYVQWDYVADTPQECVTPGTSGSGRVTSMHVWNLTGAGGGGGNSDPYAHGGNSAEIVFDLSVPEGETLSLYVPRGGLATESDPDHSASGAGGGGSAAIVLDGVVLAEAGGGGGATNSIDGGGPNDPDRFIGDDGDDACSGQGGNQDVAGTGGKGGPVDAGSCPATGGAGYPIAGEAGGDQWTGDGGDGAPGTAGAGTITGTGGWGWSRGGDGGSGETSEAAGGAGGGGGYGDGGGGAADGAISGFAVGSGGGGGSRVRSSATGGTPTYDYSSTGGSESEGDDGQIAFTMVGPAVVTRASAPTGVTASTATTHSTVDANSGMPVSTITIEYSTDPDFATDVLSVPGDPASLPGEIGDKPVQASLTGLSAGTVYYYRIVASNGEMSTAGAIDSFQTPIAVTGIDPDNGPETGGTEVTITGTGFREGTTVTIGGVACTPVHIVSATSLTCDTGVHVPATVDVVVTNDGPDPQTATLPSAYTYTPVAPDVSVTGIQPDRGPTTGGTQVTITGTGFAVGTTVTLGGAPCRPVHVVSATRLTCTSTSHAAGLVDAVVTVPGSGSAQLDDAFRYVPVPPEPPTVTGLTPDHGPTAGGTEVTFRGTGFAAGTTVTLGGAPCRPVHVISATRLTCTTTSHAAGLVDAVVTVPGRGTARLDDSFRYVPEPPAPPTVTRLTPDHGPTPGGTEVTIRGTGFTAGTTVTVGGAPCRPVHVVSATRLTCTTTAHAEGLVDAVVTVPGRGKARLDDAFRYEAPPTPTPLHLAVTADERGDRVRLDKPNRVVKGVDSNGRVKIKADCRVNGHRMGRACEITIQRKKGRVTVTPTCNDHVRVTVLVVARKHGEKETWRRQWKVQRHPRVVCTAHAKG